MDSKDRESMDTNDAEIYEAIGTPRTLSEQVGCLAFLT